MTSLPTPDLPDLLVGTLDDAACPHAGVFLRREALEAGYSQSAINASTKSGQWHRLRHGAYTTGAIWSSRLPQSDTACSPAP